MNYQNSNFIKLRRNTMNIEFKIEELYSKDHDTGSQALKFLESLSLESSALYPFLDRFISMISDDRYIVRIRGLRLVSKQSKWD